MKRILVFLILLIAVPCYGSAILSDTTGNFSNTSTWVGGVVPVSGDTVFIATGDTVTVDVDTTIGELSDPVLTCHSTGALTVAQDVTFTINGGVQLEDGKFTVNQGGTVTFDLGDGTDYNFYTVKAHFDTGQIVLNGVEGNRSTFQKTSGTSTIRVGGQGLIDGGRITSDYGSVIRIGSPSINLMNAWYFNTGVPFHINNTLFDSCGEIDFVTSIPVDVGVNFRYNSFTNGVDSDGRDISFSGHANAPTAERLFTNNVFEGAARFLNGRGLTITENYFEGGIAATVGKDPALFQYNFFDLGETGGGDGVVGFSFTEIKDTFMWYNDTGNNHFAGVSGALTTILFDGMIFENGEDWAVTPGDCISAPDFAGAGTVTVENCIALPSPNKASGTLFSALGSANLTIQAKNNTYYADGNGSPAIGETYGGHAGMVPYLKNNLAWSDGAGTSYKVWAWADVPNNTITMADYNAGYNLTNNLYTNGDLEADDYANPPGGNDIHTDPSFIDETRDLAKWGVSIGCTDEAEDDEQLCTLAALKARNDSTDPDYIEEATVQNLIEYVREGFTPENLQYTNAGENGTYIGAMIPNVPRRAQNISIQGDVLIQ